MTDRQKQLEQYKDRFCRETKHGESLLAYLHRSECGVWRCERDPVDRRRWWLNITLPDRVAEMFDAHLEIQVVYAEYEEVEPRLLELVQRRVSNSARMDHGLFIVASLDPTVERLLGRRRGEFAGIALDLRDLGTRSKDVRHRMAEVLTAVDHYDMTTPVHDPGGFFGRIDEFQQIIAAIERGQSLGVFGLRKTGKTSLLNYVAGRRREGNHPVVWVDISGLSDADQFRVRLLERTWRVVSQLQSDMPSGVKYRTLNQAGELKVPVESVRLHWVSDLEAMSRSVGGRLEVFIDEIDQLHPDRSYLGPAAVDLLVAMTQLRGMIQGAEAGSGMVMVCAGVDPALFERPLLRSGSDNLLYKMVRLMFLAPLAREEMADMVRDLGRRMGIRVRDHKVIDFLFEEYGGHPLLTRKACSLAARQRTRDQIPWPMSLAAVEAAACQRGEGVPLQQAAEILDSYAEWFPDEAALLKEAWSDDPEQRELGELLYADHPQSLKHASAYGLVVDGTVTPRIRAVARAVGYDQ